MDNIIQTIVRDSGQIRSLKAFTIGFEQKSPSIDKEN